MLYLSRLRSDKVLQMDGKDVCGIVSTLGEAWRCLLRQPCKLAGQHTLLQLAHRPHVLISPAVPLRSVRQSLCQRLPKLLRVPCRHQLLHRVVGQCLSLSPHFHYKALLLPSLCDGSQPTECLVVGTYVSTGLPPSKHEKIVDSRFDGADDVEVDTCGCG